MSIYSKISGVWNIIKFQVNGATIGRKFRVIGHCWLDLHGKCKIGDNFRCFSGFSNPMARNIQTSFRIGKDAILVIGNNVGISSACIWCDKEVLIDDDVTIGALTIITDSDAHSTDPLVRLQAGHTSNGAKTASIHIGKNVFIGTSCIICKGVTIGENSVIGAGSVVTKHIPANEIWAGNPAKLVKKLSV